jgi:hypothetical protein
MILVRAAERPPMPLDPKAQLMGIVVVEGTATPLSGVPVAIAESSETTVTDALGHFYFYNLASPSEPEVRRTLVVDAPSHARWEVQRLPIYADNWTRIIVQLSTTQPFLDRYQTATEIDSEGLRPKTTLNSRPGPVWETFVEHHDDSSALSRILSPNRAEAFSGCDGYVSQEVPPPTIKIWRYYGGFTQWYDFNFYVKHVLPSEWQSSWHQESLRSGAIAVKNYAWHWVNAGGKHGPSSSPDGVCAHLLDVCISLQFCDQVFDEYLETGETNNAIDYTYANNYKRNSVVFEAQYQSGSQCDDITYPLQLLQDASQDWALPGGTCVGPQGYQWIDDRYYGPGTTWENNFNFLLNRSFEQSVDRWSRWPSTANWAIKTGGAADRTYWLQFNSGYASSSSAVSQQAPWWVRPGNSST